jgi:glycosyltransferase involved in cell wall biosynthesis
MDNIFYFKNLNSVGGVESWLYYLSKRYNNFVFYYKEANEEQIKRLAKNIEVRKYRGEELECENFFCNYNPEELLSKVKAKNYINMIHCDYKQVSFSPNNDPKFNKNIAVSKLVGESFKEITGKEYELIYNPVEIEIPKVEKNNDGKLHLISATRLSPEKGLNRMKKLAKMLDINRIDYEWVIYTNRKREAVGDKVIYKDQQLDIIEEIAKADYLVQLSDCEAFCYSVVESLMVGTPVIITDLPVFKELGIDQKYAVICDMAMNNVDIGKILGKMKISKYEPPKSNWGVYLNNKGNYNPKELTLVRTNKRYFDVELGQLERNHEYKMTKERASYLEAKGLVNRL